MRSAVTPGCGLLLVLSALSAGAAEGPALNETARLLAGKGAAPSSKLAEYAQSTFYVEYAAQVGSGWKRFQQPNLERMRTWWASYAPKSSSTVLYPFSGPDLANALAFFPDADTYLLFGLEAPGALPDAQGMSAEDLNAGLSSLEGALGTILKVNFFITRTLEKKLGQESFNDVTGLLLFFLAMSDCEVTGARRVSLGRDGALTTVAADDLAEPGTRGRVPGVELTFRRGSKGKTQTIRYFMVDVSDDSLTRTTPNFLSYLKSQGRFVTMIKSASYLMHTDGKRDRFGQIRALLLRQSDFLVQDDSGVPLRLFARDEWRLRFHGRYQAPTTQFARYLQQDLKTELQRNSTGVLPFSYGYDYRAGESNLMTAERTQ